MKKLAIIFLIAAMALCSAGCGIKSPTAHRPSAPSASHGFTSPEMSGGQLSLSPNVVTRERLAVIEKAKEIADSSEAEQYVNVKRVAERVSKSVVMISALRGGEKVFGSGVVFSSGELTLGGESDSAGATVPVSYILTSHDVIEGCSDVKITTYDGETHTAYLVGSDPDSKITVTFVQAVLPAVEIYDDTTLLEAGEKVLAVGYPLKNLKGSVTNGIVAAPPVETEIAGGKTLIQHTAPTGGAGTGGGLFTETGFFIGMLDCGTDSGVAGIGFAVPADEVREITKNLVDTRTDATLGYIPGKFRLGVTVTETYGNLWGTIVRIVISDLDPTGSFYRSGFRVGDQLVSFKFTPKGSQTPTVYTPSYAEFFTLLDELELEVGDELVFTAIRTVNGDNVTVTLTLTILQYIYGM